MSIMKKTATAVALLTAAACASQPTTNAINREAEPLVPTVADIGNALTFAQTRDSTGHVVTLLVTGLQAEEVTAVDLARLGAPLDADVFDVMAALGSDALDGASRTADRQHYPIASLLPAGGVGVRHVATGTNFLEHAKETGVDKVFNFPKFGPATPARTSVALEPGALLDYEVEICARFDRDIRSVADFDAARKGFFLCGDFTDRARLMRMIDTKNVASGRGFSDAKSTADFFPTGPFLVVPRDWRTFVGEQRILTEVNREVRQDVRGRKMILDFRAIVQKALTNGGGGSYTFHGAPVPLLAKAMIERGGAVMSGTSEGVIFMPPRPRDFVGSGARYIFTGPMLRGESAQRVMIERFIDKERRSGRYLKAGDVVIHRSSTMGELRVRVTAAAARVASPAGTEATRR